ncbi:hypothetical protein P692DRAFT_20870191 [Suillus brevipes Sb2]|nr:hypothetical protein P692DRAFT_20870191 [Suillus brevipes Sb2]
MSSSLSNVFDFAMFWTILFEDFTIWPVRKFLWPILADVQHLTTVQQRLVTEAEEQCRQSIKAFYGHIV